MIRHARCRHARSGAGRSGAGRSRHPRPGAARPVAVLAVLALVGAACGDETAAPFGTAPVTVEPVVRVISTPASVVARTYAATVREATRIEVTAPAVATIVELDVADGDEVTEGQRLGRLRSDAVLTQIRQAESVRQVAFANERGLRDQLALVESQPVQSPNEFPDRITEAQTLLERTLAEVERLREAGATDAEINAQLVVAQQLRTELAVWAGLNDQVATAESALVAADQTLRQARAAANALVLVAPADGSVRLGADLAAGGGRPVEVGTALAPGQTIVALVSRSVGGDDVQGLRVELDVPEAALAPVTIGASVELDLEAYPGVRLTGRVERITDASDRAIGAGSGLPAVPDGLLDGLAGGLGGLAGGLGGALGGALGGVLPSLPGGVSGGDTSTATFVAEVALDDDAGLPLRPGLTGVAVLPGLSFSERFEVRLDVDEIDVLLIEEGQPVVVELDALRGTLLTGTIVAIAATPERGATGSTSYRTRVRLDVPEGDAPRLRGGLTGIGDVEVQRLEGPLTVPSTALRRLGGSEVVYVVRDGVAVEVPVRVLAFGEARAAIEGDVAEGEQVVTIGVERVEAGQTVRTG